MPKKFTDFQLKTVLTEDDYFVGINSDQNSEFKTQAFTLSSYVDSLKITGPVGPAGPQGTFAPDETLDGDLTLTGVISAYGIEILTDNTQPATLFVSGQKVGINTETPNHSLTINGSISSTGSVIFSNLPTSSTGLRVGSLYVDGGFLKIV
jgi:hypothetical protein